MKFSSHNRVAADVTPLHLKFREAGAGAHRLPRSGSRAQRGIALVVTLILLTVITFLAVAFLFLSRRERGSVGVAVDQTVSRLATEAATERAKAAVLANIIATTNGYNYGLTVSTNFVNAFGFQIGNNSLTNVNYDYPNGAPVAGNDLMQNIANLFYNPRPPVFITDKRTGVTDFRYYLDLNRNGRFETNGMLPILDINGQPITISTSNGVQVVSNYFVGDPEWIGVLDRADRPHSSSNKFVSRYCYIVVPSGMTLDLNTIGNQVKMINPGSDGFSRNMGMGPWEMNLASFFVDLNPNVWNAGALPNYFYNTNLAASSTGTAFEDARDLVRYRYNGNWANLRNVNQLFGSLGANAFRTDGADGYGRGPLMTGSGLPQVDPDNTLNNVNFGWPGADNPNHFFTTQDLFDPAKSSVNFVNRLGFAGTGLSSEDRYTYYRLLSQLGTDSGPEPAGKLHLNYANVNAAGIVVPDAQTNFVPWEAIQFFTNAADRLLRATFASTNENRKLFGVASLLSVTNVPVVVSNQFVYTPSLHRVFQLAANIFDASTNHSAAADRGGANLPSVFRPTFKTLPNGDIFINGWKEVTGANASADYTRIPRDLNDPVDRAALVADDNVYGVPWVIGAKQGLPNFNEFAMQSVAQISRKLQVVRATATARPNCTNQMFVVGISNTFAFEAWNSYRNPYNRAVMVVVANDMLMNFSYTNDVPLDMRGNSTSIRLQLASLTNLPPNAWAGYGGQISDPNPASFVVPLQTNINFLPDSIFRTESTKAFTTNIYEGTGLAYGFEQTRRFPIPQFTFAVSNRIRFIMVDRATGRVIDYVHLNDLNGVRNLTGELSDGNASDVNRTERSLWSTNRMGGSTLNNPPLGVINQIQVALGNQNIGDWNSYGQGQVNGQSKEKAIDAFRVFMGYSAMYFPGTVNTNLAMQVPFTPTRRTSQYITW